MNTSTLLALWVDRERADRLGTPRALPDVLAPRPPSRRGWSDGRWLAFFDRPSPTAHGPSGGTRSYRRRRLAL